MREFFKKLFTGEVGGEFTPFCAVHIISLVILIVTLVVLYKLFKEKDENTKNKFLNILSLLLLGLYLGDFLSHPFSNDGSEIMKSYDKLPFHLCTSCAILIPLSRILPKRFNFFKTIISTMGLIGASFYLAVPVFSGYQMISYYVFQSMLYHIVLFTYSFLSFALKDVKPTFKNIYQNAIFILLQIGIAKIANIAYASPNSHGVMSNHNWYFIEAGSLGFPFNSIVMPIMVFVVIMLGTCLIFGIYYLIRYIQNKKEQFFDSFEETLN